MSGLGDRLVAMLTGGRGGDVGGFRAAAEELRRRHGGNLTKAARAAGVDRRTYQRWFQRWRAGAEPKPRPGTTARLTAAVRDARLAPGRPNDAGVTLHTTDRDNPRRERTLTGSQIKLKAGTMDRVAAAWTATGDPEAAAVVFLAGVQDSFYRRYLTPAEILRGDRGDRGRAAGPDLGADLGGGGGRRAPGGGEEEEEEEEEEEMSWDAFYDLVAEEYDVADYDEGYGGNVA